MNKLGLLVPSLGASQMGYYICKNINDFVGSNPTSDIICYYENFEEECMHPNFTSLHIAEAWMQKGSMIATTESTAEKLIGFPGADNKYFYVWDLEWLRWEAPRVQFGNLGYSPYLPYLHPSLEIICRSKNHAEIIENNFNREVKYVVEDFNIEKIMEVIYENQHVNV